MPENLDDGSTTPGRDASTASVRSSNRKLQSVGILGSERKGKGMAPQLVRFQIDLEASTPVYFPGEEIKGYVYVNIDEDLPVQGIILRIVGEAYVNVADERRPWTAAKSLGKFRKNFKSKKISPSSLSEHTDISDSFFFRDSDDPAGSFGTTTTALTGTQSQRSTLPRDQTLPHSQPTSKEKKTAGNELRFRAHEKYFEHKVYVFGHRYSSTREVLWKGEHRFEFTYALPTKLPVSFHGRFGYVRYFCEASLERHNYPTVQRRAFFSVSSIMDLNNDPKADAGAEKDKKTNSWCFCCPSGTIIVSAKIKKRGFVPGEMIPLQAYVFNVSNKPVHTITARIIQIETYFSSKGFQKRVDETTICERGEKTLPPGESTYWDDVGPVVPPCPPSSTIIDCKLITIAYRLEFVLDIDKAKESLVLRMPLRIGTIPLEKSFKMMMDNVMALDFRDNRTYFPLSVTAKYPKLPAVYSLKCVKGDRNVNRYYFKQIPRSMHSMFGISSRLPQQPTLTDDEEEFAPRYFTYRMCPDQVKDLPNELTKKDTTYKNEVFKIMGNGNVGSQPMGNHLLIKVSPPSKRHEIVPTANGTDRHLSQGAVAEPCISNGGRKVAGFVDVDPGIVSGGSSVNIPSSLCSPSSFRSYQDGNSRVFAKKLELNQHLANIGNWELDNFELRKRSNKMFTNGNAAETVLDDNGNKKDV